MISQVWICKCDLCGVEERAKLRVIEKAGLTHLIPDYPDEWQYCPGKLVNNHHVCPDCWQGILEEAKNDED